MLPPTSSHKKYSINIVVETFRLNFFEEALVTSFVFNKRWVWENYSSGRIKVFISTYKNQWKKKVTH